MRGISFVNRICAFVAIFSVALTFTLFAGEAPNIIVILADDLGSGDVGWRGGDIKTPNLDKLAMGGARLEQFYVQPLCSPTRAALLTGRYPMRHGLQVGVVRPWADFGLPLGERTMAQALREAGYATAIFGKWHLGHSRAEYLPTRRGFDRQYGHYNGALDHFTHIRDGGFDWHRDDKVCRDEGYTTELIARETVRFIGGQSGKKPFFVYVPFSAVHAPLQVPEDYKKPYAQFRERRATYAGMLAALDQAVGEIVLAVEARGWRTNTLIFFSTDNGGPNPRALTSNAPFRAGKGAVYEGGVRACAFMNWPGQIRSNTVVRAPLHIVDLYPTFLKLAGASSAKQELPVDGRDCWMAVTRGASSPHDEILINAGPRSGALRAGDWKIVVNGNRPESEDDVEEPEEKSNGERVELFNVATDPSEKNNVAASETEKLREMRGRYEAFAKQQVPAKARPKPANFKSPEIWGEVSAK
jgi:arylsulfatase A-like enzyme